MPADRDEWVRWRFEDELRARLRTLVTPALVAEHAAAPTGRHGADLQRVLDFLRTRPVGGKYVAVTATPSGFRIGVLTGERGTPISVLTDAFDDEPSVLHAIFLRRLRDLGIAA